MPPSTSSIPTTKYWLEHREKFVSRGRGLFLYGTSDTSPFSGPDRLKLEMKVNGVQPLVLGSLTESLMSDGNKVQSLKVKADEALTAGRPIIGWTSLQHAELHGNEESTEDPPDLDTGRLLARGELAHQIRENCIHGPFRGKDGVAYLTYIEEKMALALESRNLAFRSQVAFPPFTADFVVSAPDGRSLIVECDGAAFHDREIDQARDRELLERGWETLRFAGWEIVRDAQACARKVQEFLEGSSSPAGTASARPSSTANLSDEQRTAAQHGFGPARVAAPAGAGKTRVIETRIRELVSDGIQPGRICAISFTNKAVKEMAARLPEYNDDQVGRGVKFATLHSLAREIATKAPGAPYRRLIQDIAPESMRYTPTRWEIVRSLLKEKEFRFQSSNRAWVEAITYYRDSHQMPLLAEWPKEARPSKKRFLEICAEYDSQLRKRKLWDYAGMIWEATRSLATDSEYRASWSGKFDHWVIDEYQDLPNAKLQLVRLLASPAQNLFVVGDDDQVIYEFSGASPNIFRRFSEQFSGAAEYTLSLNYRSPHELVTRTTWLISRNSDRVDKGTRPHADPVPTQRRVTISCEDNYDELAVNFIEECSQTADLQDIAILFRLRDFALPVEAQLDNLGVPYIRCSHTSFLESLAFRSLASWLNVAEGGRREGWIEAVERTLKWPNRYLKYEVIDALLSDKAIQSASDPEALAAQIRKLIPDVDGPGQREGLKKYCLTLEKLPSNTRNPATLLDSLTLRPLLEEMPKRSGETAPEIVHDIVYRLACQFSTTGEMLGWIARNKQDPDYDFEGGEDTRSKDATHGKVTLSSIHQAKGKEWPHVAVAGPQDGMPDSRATLNTELEEERRIAYVAATRAQESLLFVASRRYGPELERSPEGLSYEDFLEGRSEPSAPVDDSEKEFSPWGSEGPTGTRVRGTQGSPLHEESADPPAGAVMRKGVWILSDGSEPTPTGTYTCPSCGLNVWARDDAPKCPDCEELCS